MSNKGKVYISILSNCETRELGSIYANSGNSDGRHYYFLARGCKVVREQDLDEDEFIDVVTVPIEEVENYLKNDKTFSGTLFIGMSYLRSKGIK